MPIAAIVSTVLVLVVLGAVLLSVGMVVRTLRQTNDRLAELKARLQAVEERAGPLGDDVQHLQRELAEATGHLRSAAGGERADDQPDRARAVEPEPDEQEPEDPARPQ